MDFLSGLTSQPWWLIVMAGVGLFSAVATLTPNKVDDKILQFLLDVVNFLGGNLGKAKNKE